jgi:hypothetical protein
MCAILNLRTSMLPKGQPRSGSLSIQQAPREPQECLHILKVAYQADRNPHSAAVLAVNAQAEVVQ